MVGKLDIEINDEGFPGSVVVVGGGDIPCVKRKKEPFWGFLKKERRKDFRPKPTIALSIP